MDTGRLIALLRVLDVKLSETDREYPDHLVTELEFAAWLCMQEQTATQKGDDALPYRRAARDFLDRHLVAWLPHFRKRLEATETAYAQYGTTLAELVEIHRGWLGNELQESGETQ